VVPGLRVLGLCPIVVSKRRAYGTAVLLVQDLPARIAYLKNQGVHFRNEMEVGSGGRQIQVEDPDGNLIELFEPARATL
jgi:glyoxylase I family protein